MGRGKKSIGFFFHLASNIWEEEKKIGFFVFPFFTKDIWQEGKISAKNKWERGKKKLDFFIWLKTS